MQLLVRLQNFAAWLLRRRLRWLARSIEIFIRIVYSARIPAATKIAPSVFFAHNALAVVLNECSIIGKGCEVGTHVVLGGNPHASGAPILQENVVVMTGAKLIGKITIGTGSVIAANAIVLIDIPPRCLAGGIPAKVLRENIDSSTYKTRRPVR
jgi:serine O-acetyltransferase